MYASSISRQQEAAWGCNAGFPSARAAAACVVVLAVEVAVEVEVVVVA